MGEIADAMLDGDLCEHCGVALDEEDFGYPRICPGCKLREQQEARDA